MSITYLVTIITIITSNASTINIIMITILPILSLDDCHHYHYHQYHYYNHHLYNYHNIIVIIISILSHHLYFIFLTVDGLPTEWAPWGYCSKSCGSAGLQYRYRRCIKPAPKFDGLECPENTLKETRPCTKPSCDGKYYVVNSSYQDDYS